MAVAFALLCSFAAGCATLLPQRPDPNLPSVDRQTIEKRVTTYFRKAVTLPRAAELTMTYLTPASIPGWQRGALEVRLEGRSQAVDFLVSNDAHYLLRGELADLTVDPIQVNLAKLSLKDQPTRGSPEAPVTIVEFTDFQCQYCARTAKSVETELLRAYRGKVRLVHKDLPLTEIHPWAESAAVASECAFAQSNDAFWKIYDEFYRQQDRITSLNLKETAARLARQSGLDMTQYNRCVESRASLPGIHADIAEATTLGVNSTPTFFINGRKLTGVQPLEAFRVVIDEELGRH